MTRCIGIKYPGEIDTEGKCLNDVSKYHPFLCDSCDKARTEHVRRRLEQMVKEFKS